MYAQQQDVDFLLFKSTRDQIEMIETEFSRFVLRHPLLIGVYVCVCVTIVMRRLFPREIEQCLQRWQSLPAFLASITLTLLQRRLTST